MTETITEAARREAEERIGGVEYVASPARDAFVEGALFGAAWERDRESTDPEEENDQ